MSFKKLVVIGMWLVLGGITGWLTHSATVGKYNIINATCSVINAAVDNHLLATDQVRLLGEVSQKNLLNSAAGDAFQLDEQQIQSASSSSNCSQFMVGMSSH
ncbi:hypothetical protein [Rosenbergiella australiborealis]|uniref:Uncharacterized protein n=1 Tax=Rosenbergiella australiborealis TaxID=1544696 RepID=A0ABS5T2U3_9GAMM|nr:hypothetical protein [Rosenbergiella australiborealis]MBT0726679.1 hypothetical protein [Rosenbergiella australiborealis]